MADKKFRSLNGDQGFYVLDTASWRSERPVMDKEKCIECGICMSVCPVFAIEGTEDKKYYITYNNCKGCGLCAFECPKDAIDMVNESEAQKKELKEEEHGND